MSLAGALQVTHTCEASGMIVSELPLALHDALGVHMTVTLARRPEDNLGAPMFVTPTPRSGARQPSSGSGVERVTAPC